MRNSPRQIWISSTDGSRQTPLTTGSDPDWSSSGWIAFRRGGQLFRVRADGTGLRQLTGRGGSSPSWAPGGRKLAFLRDGGVYALDVPTGRLESAVPDRAFNGPAYQVRWSPDGGSFAIVGESLTRWDRRVRRSTMLLHMVEGDSIEHNHHLHGIAWQPLR
ncbi:MAG TPA: hypothetical protein VLK58_07935 [Conexibacter sp.]|nr:hypothetical protein [Conexibacter sp.]